MKIVQLIVIIFIINGVQQKGFAQESNNMENSENKTLDYFDGSGNHYKITGDSIIYEPVSQEMSSSGIYSGGYFTKREIKSDEFETIFILFEEIFNNKKIQIKHRIKTSGLLTIRIGNSERETIIKPSEEMKKLEITLKKMLE